MHVELEVAMNTLALREKLLAKRIEWERIAGYMLESASMDINSNVTFDVAQKHLAQINRSLKRIDAGLYGQCEKCRCQIDPERLETLIESDCHLCVRCAETVRVQTTRPPKQHYLRPTPRRPVYAGQYA
jgi:RNA polymerase-binding transcription factor DksA